MNKTSSRPNVLKLISAIFVVVFLLGCGVPTESMTPTALPILTSTITSSPTSTASPTATTSPTPTSDPVADRLEENLSPIDIHEGTQQILTEVKTVMQLDETYKYVADSFEIIPEAVELFFANAFYEIWKTGNRNSSFDDFAQKISSEDVVLPIKTQNLKDINVVLGKIKNPQTEAREITEIVFAIVDNEDPKFKDLNNQFRADLNPDGKLIIYAYVTERFYSGHGLTDHVRDGNAGIHFAHLSSLLKYGRTTNESKNLINILLDGGLAFHYLRK